MVACLARSVSTCAALTSALNAESSTCDRSQPPSWVNSGGMTVEAFGQSGPQPATPKSPALAGSKTVL